MVTKDENSNWFCTCEDFLFGNRMCKHIKYVSENEDKLEEL